MNELNSIFTELYFYMRNKLKINPNNIENKTFVNYNNKIMICCIGKNENLYAKEFVEYYVSLGFDKIIILDNNDLNGEKFEDVLHDFISKKLVEIKDLRGLKSIQIPSYNYCYQKYMYLYDWIAFFDFDEYLFIKENSTIKKYLFNDMFKKCQLVLFNWYMYDDNNLLRRDNRNMIQRFTSIKDFSKKTKFIVRGRINNLKITSSHIAINCNYCNSKGETIYPKSYKTLNKEINSIAYLKHFYTKTAEEYCNKINKGDVQFRNIKFKKEWKKKKKLKYFFNTTKILDKKCNY